VSNGNNQCCFPLSLIFIFSLVCLEQPCILIVTLLTTKLHIRTYKTSVINIEIEIQLKCLSLCLAFAKSEPIGDLLWIFTYSFFMDTKIQMVLCSYFADQWIWLGSFCILWIVISFFISCDILPESLLSASRDKNDIGGAADKIVSRNFLSTTLPALFNAIVVWDF